MKRLSEFLFILYSAVNLYLAVVAFFQGEPEEDDGDWDEERKPSRKKKKRRHGTPRDAFL